MYIEKIIIILLIVISTVFHVSAAPSCASWETSSGSTGAGPGQTSEIYYEADEHGKSCTSFPAVDYAEVEVKCEGTGPDGNDKVHLYLQTFPGGSTTGWSDSSVTLGDSCGRYGCDNYDSRYTSSSSSSSNSIDKTISLPKTSGSDEIPDVYALCWAKNDDGGDNDGWAWVTSNWGSWGNGNIDEAPTASFSYTPSNPGIGESVSFDGTESSDPDGDYLEHEWDFGDGSSSIEDQPSHSYSSPNSYTVDLTVDDYPYGSGAYKHTDSISKTITVTDQTSPTTTSSPSDTTGRDPTIEGELQDNYQLSSYTLELDGSEVSSGSLSGTSETVAYSASSLSLGDHTYTWTVEDSAGNQVTNQYSFTVSLLKTKSNANTVNGGIWVQSGSLRWGTGSKEYWINEAEKLNSISGSSEGSIWVQGDALHWIDVNKYERKYAGPITESNVAGPTGALWIQDKHIHYIDQDGDERILNGQ